ncbi:hypothetical protein PABG_05343 [Paracoccidioides brasiliensis Pb03]|nr:hypothetical protein PABG_05343 [Paracoccidioides brasiliensis Pb03]
MGDRATAVGDSESGRGKGKDKAVADKPADDLSMGEEEESSSDESVAEDVAPEGGVQFAEAADDADADAVFGGKDGKTNGNDADALMKD